LCVRSEDRTQQNARTISFWVSFHGILYQETNASEALFAVTGDTLRNYYMREDEFKTAQI
jgi:hypothetical protein